MSARRLIAPEWVDMSAAQRAGLGIRQVQVLAGYVAGLSREDIARELRLAEITVRDHVRRAHAALGVSSSVQAVARCYDLGVFLPSPARRWAA